MGVERRMKPSKQDLVAPATGLTLQPGRLLVLLPGLPCVAHVNTCQGRSPRDFSLSIGPASMVLAAAQRTSIMFTPDRARRELDEGDLCCILAFVDAALMPAEQPGAAGSPVSCQPVPQEATTSTAQLGHWLTAQVMQGEANNELLRHLRRQESYALACYLLKNPVEGAHLNELCVKYGLSYTHFRRLCRRSLGGSIKTRLRAWRAARTVLDIIDSDQSILEIAVDNGYTSASHVSTDIKQLFGFTPRTARNARKLLP